MSFLRGTNVECIAASAVAGTPISNNATAGVLNPADGAAYLPIGFWNGQLYRTIKLRASGIYSSPASAPATMQLGLTFNTTEGTIATLTILSAAITPAVSMTNAIWDLDMEVTASTYTETAGAGTVNVMGIGWLMLHSSSAGAAGAVYPVGGTTLVSVSTFVGYFVETYGKFGTAVAGSSMQGERFSVYGCN